MKSHQVTIEELHRVSAESLVFSATGLSSSKSLKVVVDLRTHAVSYRVNKNGKEYVDTPFAQEAIAKYNELP